MNYYEHIIGGLQVWSGMISNEKKSATIHMLRHFIELMGEDEFNQVFEDQFINQDDFDNSWIDFHKSMRQHDFFDMGEGSGHIDMLFWQFIYVSNIPYQVFKTFTEKIKVGIIDEFDNDDFKTSGWNKFGFLDIQNNEA